MFSTQLKIIYCMLLCILHNNTCSEKSYSSQEANLLTDIYFCEPITNGLSTSEEKKIKLLEKKKEKFITETLLHVQKNKKWSTDNKYALIHLHTYTKEIFSGRYFKGDEMYIKLLFLLIDRQVNETFNATEIRAIRKTYSCCNNKIYFLSQLYPLSCCLKNTVGNKMYFLIMNQIASDVVNSIDSFIKNFKKSKYEDALWMFNFKKKTAINKFILNPKAYKDKIL